MAANPKRLPKGKGKRGSKTGTLGKALAILDIIAGAGEPPRFTEILKRARQPRGTLHRHLSHLLAEGLVEINNDQTYDLGLRALHFASRAWQRNRLRNLADPFMRALNQATQETVHLGLLHGQDVIYIDKLESPKAVRMHSQIGNVSPVYCTGVGKAALSCLEVEEVGRIARAISYRRYTAHTISSAEELIKEVAMVKKRGLAYDREEHEAGIFCIAAPIAGPSGRFAAGISVTLPAYRAKKRQVAAWERLVSETAVSIAKAAQDRLGPRG